MTILGWKARALALALAATACGDDSRPSGGDGGAAHDGEVLAIDGGMPRMDGSSTRDGGGVRTDGGDPSWPDAGGLPDPEWSVLAVGPLGSCPEWTACGGDIVGTWDVSGGCVEVDVESTIEMCPGAMVTRRDGRARGRVVFGADGLAHRVGVSEVEMDIFIPAICASVVSCPMIEAAMAGYVTEAACTTTAAGACDCTARQLTFLDDRDVYRIEANEIVAPTAGKRWEFCIEGDDLRYRDTSPTGPREPGTIELARR